MNFCRPMIWRFLLNEKWEMCSLCKFYVSLYKSSFSYFTYKLNKLHKSAKINGFRDFGFFHYVVVVTDFMEVICKWRRIKR